jgi:hypothetical protein
MFNAYILCSETKPDKVADGLPKVTDGLPKVTDGLPKVTDGLPKVTDGLPKDAACLRKDTNITVLSKQGYNCIAYKTLEEAEDNIRPGTRCLIFPKYVKEFATE